MVVRSGEVQIENNKVKAVMEWKTFTKIKDTQWAQEKNYKSICTHTSKEK